MNVAGATSGDPRYNKICAQCGTPYVADKRNWRKSRYCSKRCLQQSKKATRDRWVEDNKEHLREYRRRNQAKTNARQLARYYADHEASKQKQRDGYQRLAAKRPWAALIWSVRGRAKEMGLAMDLTEEWAKERWTGKCELTGIPFNLQRRRGGSRIFWPSIDRVDAGLGYTQSNCRIILFGVNALRSNGSDAEMMVIALALASKNQVILQTRTADP